MTNASRRESKSSQLIGTDKFTFKPNQTLEGSAVTTALQSPQACPFLEMFTRRENKPRDLAYPASPQSREPAFPRREPNNMNSGEAMGIPL